VHLFDPITIPAVKKPLGRGALVDERLRDLASGLYLLKDGETKAVDLLGSNSIAFGASAASPTWGSRNCGQGLGFDGADDCFAAITAITAPPAWVACSFVLDNLTGTQCPVGLGSTGATFPGFVYIYMIGGTVNAQVRWQDNTTAATITGPTAIAGEVYHCLLVSRGAADHVLWVNGVKYRSTSSVSIGSSMAVVSIGSQRRNVSGAYLTGLVQWAGFGAKDVPDQLALEVTRNPWPFLFKPQKSIFLLRAPTVLGNRRRRIIIGEAHV
jgi:hypothetical protein